ncbi:MAG: RibD family protein [Phormidesmis sp.]
MVSAASPQSSTAADRINRPYVTAILAMSADGKITDAKQSAARFPSAADKSHLERQIASSDATLFGASTLRAYHTTLYVSDLDLIEQRRSQNKPDQPVQIVCSASGNLDNRWRFFQQPVPRRLITTLEGLQYWKDHLAPLPAPFQNRPQDRSQQDRSQEVEQKLFEHVLITERPFDWHKVMQNLYAGTSALSAIASRRPIKQLLVMGGGELVASLLAVGLVDELYLTVCPLLIGGKTAPTPVGGLGFTLPRTPQLKLESAEVKGDEVFLHYRVGASSTY